VWQSVYRFQAKVADRLRVGRVLLAGDCAHLFSPFGARGLNSGVADAENAAWKLACVLRGWAGAASIPGLLESYHAERHAAALENLAVTSATMDFLVPHNRAQHEHRRLVLAGAASDRAGGPAGVHLSAQRQARWRTRMARPAVLASPSQVPAALRRCLGFSHN
jgi:3-(3-hydroxy-phenyl)propionate hydroxylase